MCGVTFPGQKFRCLAHTGCSTILECPLRGAVPISIWWIRPMSGTNKSHGGGGGYVSHMILISNSERRTLWLFCLKPSVPFHRGNRNITPASMTHLKVMWHIVLEKNSSALELVNFAGTEARMFGNKCAGSSRDDLGPPSLPWFNLN